MVMMAFILATDFDFIAYMSKMAFFSFFLFFFFFFEAFFTPMAFLEYDNILSKINNNNSLFKRIDMYGTSRV